MPYKKGQSGNPGGRPKSDQDFIALARSRSIDAIEVLSKIMNDEKSAASSRISAASILLDRGYGKAVQQLKHESEMSPNFADMLREGAAQADAAHKEWEEERVQKLVEERLRTINSSVPD